MNQNELNEKLAAQTFPKVTPDVIKSRIRETQYFRQGTLTICVLTLVNGFQITGESACVDERNFDQGIGETIAYKMAFDKIWALEGYVLANAGIGRARHEVRARPAHQMRVIEELAQLQERTEKLGAFVDSSIFGTLPEDEKRRLGAQHGAMTYYAEILKERVAAFGSAA